MAITYLLPKEGNFYKANLHAHSTASDGALTPAELKTLYKAGGYQVFAYTDHNVLNYFEELSDPEFLVLCGYELHVSTEPGESPYPKTCHLNAIAREPSQAVLIPRPTHYDAQTINRVIEQLVEANYIVFYNHPGWSSEGPGDYLPLKNLTAMEIYNTSSELLNNYGDGRLHYDLALKNGMRLYCLATDDNHDRRPTGRSLDDAMGGWTTFKAPELSYPAIIRAFDRGEFYCSTGPEIYEYYIDGQTLHLRCSVASGIFLKTARIGVAGAITSVSSDLTSATFNLADLREEDRYFRVEIVDKYRNMAFTNPYYLK